MANLAAVYSDAKAIIDSASAQAATLQSAADSHVNTAITDATNYELAALSILVPSPTDLPVVPLFDSAQDFDGLFQTRRQQFWDGLEARVQQDLAGWMDVYAPKLEAQIQPDSDAWLLNAINNGKGLPVAVEQQIWDRARQRDTQEALRLEQEAIDGYAARGFSLPPGALAARILAVQQAASEKSSQTNRDVAIKQAEIMIDVSKYALQLTTELRLGVARVAADFIRMAIAIPAQASSDANSVIRAKEVLQQMIASYVSSKMAVARIEWEHSLKQADMNLATTDLVIKDKLQRSSLVNQASVAGAEAAAQIAAAAINSQQTLANVTYQGTESN